MADDGRPEVDEHANTESLAAPFVPSAPVRLAGVERFTLLKRLGQGGMGTVYAAYDSTLDRKVALKVVRADRRSTNQVVSPRDQLLREAQAMARLSHPNVVTVHEVGEIGDDIFVVIELAEGGTLEEWLKERKRPWREIVGAFVQAGRGLAAAHDAGLVHRDFKPQNVLVRLDGRIQVTDFGVVSMGGGSSDSTEPHAVGELTFTGRRVGTVAYMAPEQHAAGSVDGRADQFSFAVSLWTALYGTRPFVDEDRFAAIRAGRIQPPATTPVSAHVEAALRRALAPTPEARWPTMQELLDELARDPARERRRRLAIAGLAAGVVAIAAIAAIGWTRRAPAAEPCTGMDAHLAGRWDAARSRALAAAFAARPDTASAGAHVTGELDGWATRWLAMRVEACRATRVSGEQSEALLDARMHCLDRELDEVDQLVTALTGEPAAAARTIDARPLGLPELAACADRENVIARIPPPVASRDGIQRIEHELAGIRAVERVGKYRDARARADRAAADALALGFAPLAAEALLVRGEIEEEAGDLAAARASLADAATRAAGAGDDRTTARSLLSLVGVLEERAETQAALGLAIAAAAAVARTHDASFEAELAEQLGAVHATLGDADAEPHLARALALREEAAHDSLAVAQVLNKLAGVWAKAGRTADARAAYERALRIASAQLGNDHPATAIARANLCYLDAEAGKLAEARACQEAVLATLERALGSEHSQVAWALNEVALVQREQGDVDGAVARFERALAIWEKVSGPTHPDVAWPLINLGEIANARGDRARAETSCRRALAIVEQAATAPADAIPALTCLANALASARDARAMAQRALELARTAKDDAAITSLEKWLATHR